MKKDTVNRVLDNKGTSGEARDVARWLATPEGQMDVASRMDAEWNLLVDEAQARGARNDKAHNVWKYINRAAAVLFLLFMGGVIFQMVKMKTQTAVEMREVSAPRGEQMLVVLQDGTMVHLNSGSRIQFPSRFTDPTRTVSLVGEAYFDVEKDAGHPFMVDMNGASIEVLGTSFNVSAYANEQLCISLDEGSVLFHGADQDVQMRPGEVLTYNRVDGQITSCKGDTQLASAWKSHRIEVKDMSMKELTDMLSRRYDVTFAINDEACYQHIYSLSMSDADLRSVINNMAYVSPISVQYDPENKVVTIQSRN